MLRPGDTAARFGGDEFVLLCEDLAGEQDALAIAERVVLRLREPFRLRGRGGHGGRRASVGVAIVGAGADADAVLRDADAALYRAKTLGRSRYEVFDATMRARAVERMQIESGLRRAVERGELELALQPIVALSRRQRCAASRPCCAGAIRSAACSRPATSSRWPRRRT